VARAGPRGWTLACGASCTGTARLRPSECEAQGTSRCGFGFARINGLQSSPRLGRCARDRRQSLRATGRAGGVTPAGADNAGCTTEQPASASCGAASAKLSAAIAPLQDRAKVAAGPPEFQLAAVDLVTTPTAVHHLSRCWVCLCWPAPSCCLAPDCVRLGVPLGSGGTHNPHTLARSTRAFYNSLRPPQSPGFSPLFAAAARLSLLLSI
jgi:hypothetical protein